MSAAAARAPRVPDARLVGGADATALLNVETGRLFALDALLLRSFEAAMEAGDPDRVRILMAAAGMADLDVRPPVPTAVPVRSISLAIAAKCNLACTYCYAEQGTFGGADRPMSEEVALAAIETLVANAAAGDTVRVTFLGGEPLANRTLLYAATRHALARGASAGVEPAFSVTTNATLLTQADADFFDEHAFAVTISLDGIGAAHDRLRPARGGRPTYERVVERARLLLSRPARRCHVAARASVTPANLDLPATLQGLAGQGFDSIQFSPVLSSPTGRGEMAPEDLSRMLDEMIACGRLFEKALADGIVLPFANLLSTLRRIHGRARDEYPCGAGGSYMGVSAVGGLYACHRFVDDESARLGDAADGVDAARQAQWLAERNVRHQEPCRSCWARHLCGGGCHFEVVRRGRPACDYIRGWLDYCLDAYVRLRRTHSRELAAVLAPQPGHRA